MKPYEFEDLMGAIGSVTAQANGGIRPSACTALT
jgi:hypothetical protein